MNEAAFYNRDSEVFDGPVLLGIVLSLVGILALASETETCAP